jgi:UDP-N-acetylglucosamine--N-acetylmuramyl-(pentapeptide) pyrophosphoryl-undecaprenol N-acetylglucosamine transferase
LLTGTPIRKIEDYSNFEYPSSVDKKRRTILICGGSQGAMSMNTVLVKAVKWFSQNNFQVIWQTGVTGESEIKKEFEGDENLIIYSSFTDLYPYYSIAELLIGRAGAGTISEALLFSLPSIFIPLPWSAENHQWYNAGYAQDSGWALRLEQNENVSDKITEFMENCEKNIEIFEKMKNCASQSCENAAKIIAEAVL